jgi:hypothetical protein
MLRKIFSGVEPPLKTSYECNALAKVKLSPPELQYVKAELCLDYQEVALTAASHIKKTTGKTANNVLIAVNRNIAYVTDYQAIAMAAVKNDGLILEWIKAELCSDYNAVVAVAEENNQSASRYCQSMSIDRERVELLKDRLRERAGEARGTRERIGIIGRFQQILSIWFRHD